MRLLLGRSLSVVLALAPAPVASVRQHGRELPGEPGLPQDGDWKYKTTEWLAREQVGKCVHPELAHDDLTWRDELVDEAARARRSQEFNAQSWTRPINWKWRPVTPEHRAVVFTSGRHTLGDTPVGLDYPGSRCYDFDYDAPTGSVPDPHGCGLFRRSFSRLKRLRACAVGALERSSSWSAYRRVVTAIRAKWASNSTGAASPWRRGGRDDIEVEHMMRAKRPGGSPKVTKNANPDAVDDGSHSDDQALQAIMETCADESKCYLMDAYRRVDEMIKYLSWQSWAALKKPLRTWAESKVRYTRSFSMDAARQRQLFGLEQAAVDSIVGDCLGVPRGADGMAYDQLPQETRLLERSLSCNGIMWDQVHVPGVPQPPVTDAVAELEPQGRLRYDLKTTTPLCGRVAGAMAIYSQVHSKGGFTVMDCSYGFSEEKPWRDCVDGGRGFNCICLELCWRTALRLACDLAPGCC